jgi:5'-nucleotidase
MFSEEPSSPRARAPLTILQINDVYSTLPIDGLGGLARVATLKQQLAKAGRTPLLVIAGDFLSPSVASSVFKGEQMVAALNAAGLDLATLGNHEFDFGADVLLQRMKESRFQWVVSNVVDASGRPIGGAVPYLVRSFGSLKVGFIGLCLTSEQISSDLLGGMRLTDPYEAAAKYLPVLKAENVDAIVAVTHLSIAEDRVLAERFPEIDLIVGGHEHYPMTISENRTLISKAGSDARYVARIDLNRRGGVVERYFELVSMTSAFADEPRTADVVASYERRLGPELDTVIATSPVSLDAEELRLRASETNLGSLVADAMRSSVGADVALMNAGGIRGDRVYPAGPISRRTLLAMHPFGNIVTKIEITGRLLVQALTHGVSRLPATAGAFPQVSGLTMRVDLRGGERVRDVIVGGQPIDLERTYTLALADYILTGGDGYAMFADSRVLVGRESGELIVSAVEKFLTATGGTAVPQPGRITIVR